MSKKQTKSNTNVYATSNLYFALRGLQQASARVDRTRDSLAISVPMEVDEILEAAHRAIRKAEARIEALLLSR